MSLKSKIISFLVIILIINGIASVSVLIKNLNDEEFEHIEEDNQRIVTALTKELFTDIEIWGESQTIEGPYGFKKGEIKEIQEKFIQFFQEITGQNTSLLNIYNNQSRVVASSFSEFEGKTAKQLNESEIIENVLKTGVGFAEFEDIEEVHPQLYWKRPEGSGDVLEVFTPIKIDGKIVGVVEAYFLPEIELRSHIISMSITTGISILIIILFIYLFFYRYIIRPIDIIRKATYPISKGEFRNFIKIKQKDEIGSLADDFNRMTRGLNSLSGEIVRLKEVGKMKSEFISIVAHQLRTPIAGIKWVLETIADRNIDAGTRNWFDKIQELNDRMIKMINDFLNAARIEEGKFGYRFARINLTELLEKVVKDHQIDIIKRNVSVSFSEKPSDSVYIEADLEKLEIVFDNLLENAINYTKRGGSININLLREDNFVTIKIIDTGIGIKEDDIPKLFSRFFRSKEAISMRPSGSGIGLFVTRNIVRKHGGSIDVKSQLNKGTTFYIKLPMKLKDRSTISQPKFTNTK